MNPELPRNPREEMELRITALLLGELPEGETAAVREALTKDPELTKLHDDLKATIQLVRSTATKEVESVTVEAAHLKLSEARRKKLLTVFAIPPLKPSQFRSKPQFQLRLVEWVALLAIVAAIAAISVVPIGLVRRESDGVTTATELAVSRYAANSALKRAQAEILAQTLSDDAGKHTTVAGRPEAEFSDYLKQVPRRLTTAESLPAVPPVEPAKPRAAIVLPSVAEADGDKLAAGALVQQPHETTLAFSVPEPQSIAAGDTLAEDRFYRFSDGGVGGAAAQGGGATPAVVDQVPVLGDVPTVGKAFRESETLKRDGAVLADNFAASDFAAVPDSGVVTNVWYGANTTRGEKIDSLAIVDPSNGLPSLKPQEEVQLGRAVVPMGNAAAETAMRGAVVAGVEAAQDKSRAESLGANAGQFGTFVPQAQSLKFREAVSTPPAQQPATSGGFALSPTPTTPAVAEAEGELMERYGIAAGEVKKGVADQTADPARQRNESLSSGLRGSGGERGRQLVQEGRLLLEAGKPVEAETRLKAALEADPESQAAHYYLSCANEAKYRQAERARERTPKDTIVKYERDVISPTAQQDTGKQPLTRRFQVDPETLRQGLQTLGDDDGTEVQSGSAAGVPRVYVAGGNTPDGASGQGSRDGGVRFLTRTNYMQEVHERIQKLFAAAGVDLKANGKTVFFNDRTGELFVRGTEQDLEKVAQVSQLLSENRSEKEIKERLAELKQTTPADLDASGAAPATFLAAEYYNKKRELESLRQFESILSTKLAAERIDFTVPRAAMVEIVDKAQPAPAKKPSFLARLTGNTDSEAVARITIDRDVADIEGVKGSRTAIAYDPYFIPTQFEIIQSEAVLGKVVESLGLDQAWAKNGQKLKTTDAVALLKQKLELQPVKDTSLLEIRAKDENPEEAAKIANAVAETYAEYRNQERSRLSQGSIKVLEERYQEQLEKITKAQEEVEALRQRLNISHTDAGGNALVAPVKAEVDTPLPRKSATNAPIPQPEIQASEDAFSTFSLNVSDVSFKLAAASLEQGQMPDAASVRSEEFINAFDYRDPEAAPGVPIAFAWERARHPFAQNRDLLRFSLKTAAAGRPAGRPLNVVLLLDNSGSMERADRVHIIREALAVLATQLQPKDKLSVITFARTPRLVADGVPGDKAGELAEQVSDLTPQGGTNLEDAMNLAYATAARHYLASGINRVVLLTDGAANLGNVEPETLKQKVEVQRKQGIALDAFGIGWEGFNDDLLEVLSRNGDGRYGFINSPEEAATDFVGQLAGALKVAASDVKVQVEFNPKRVTAYRQIGYAKHQLTKEQFRDNTVDAAEIAAQEAGSALYTVEVNPAGEGPLGTVRVRYKIPGTTDYREQAWDVPYTGAVAALEHSSPAMRLAASASAFSEWLVASPFAGEVTPDRLLGYLGGVPEVYGVDERPKKLEWMIRQAKSFEGK